MRNRKEILYLTNIEVPYRVRFFNELARHCDLTVLYERECSANRDAAWASGNLRHFQHEILGGMKIRNENGFSLKIINHITANIT